MYSFDNAIIFCFKYSDCDCLSLSCIRIKYIPQTKLRTIKIMPRRWDESRIEHHLPRLFEKARSPVILGPFVRSPLQRADNSVNYISSLEILPLIHHYHKPTCNMCCTNVDCIHWSRNPRRLCKFAKITACREWLAVAMTTAGLLRTSADFRSIHILLTRKCSLFYYYFSFFIEEKIISRLYWLWSYTESRVWIYRALLLEFRDHCCLYSAPACRHVLILWL